MTPTRKYIDTKDVQTNPFAVVIALLVIALVLGALILGNIEVWDAIFN